MPLNAGPEFFKAQMKYQEAKTREEKIAALEEMLETAPKHKGADHLLAELKSKLAKLKKSKTSKAARHSTAVQKEGDIQIVILGLTQSGKSTLLSTLTNAKPKITPIPYTTTKPQVGVAEWKGVKIQLVEIPSTFNRQFMSIAHSADGVIFLYSKAIDQVAQQQVFADLLERFRLKKPFIEIMNDNIDADEIFSKLWEKLNLIKVYTKEPKKKPQTKALVLKADATIRNAAKHLHQDFLKFFKFARISGPSAKFAGEKVGLEHKLKDGDILEIRMG